MSTNTKRWIIEGGNSTEGAVGFVLRGVRAASAIEALHLVQQTYALPEETHNTYDDGHDLSVYFNAEALTLTDVREDEEQDAPRRMRQQLLGGAQ
jgi:hypothetical protein